jgi:DNA-binding SARP family transcriptional activator
MTLPNLEHYLAPEERRPSARRGRKPSAARKPQERAVAPLRLRLLGGFRVERGGTVLPDCVWRRRTARTLTKLLATHPGHALHRDQVIDILWPDVGASSALNSLGKALHAARRALEPELPPRGVSAYLWLKDEMVILGGEHVTVDADEFELLAHRALEQGAVSAFERALAAYTGALLPEDRYADWSEDRRGSLHELHLRLLVAFADVLEQSGADSRAADSLRSALRNDATREDVHRRLMHIYAKLGTPAEALRQFYTCRQVLQRELNTVPGRETEALYRDLLGSRNGEGNGRRAGPEDERMEWHGLRRIPNTVQTSFVGRKRILQLLHEQLSRAERGRGLVILVSGETGVGKTRLVAQFLDEARRRGAASVEGGSGRAHRVGDSAREDPALVRFAPSFASEVVLTPSLSNPSDAAKLQPLVTVVQLLTNLDGTQPVIVVLGDVEQPAASGAETLETLGRLAARRPWLMVGTAHESELEAAVDMRPKLKALAAQGLCLNFHLGPLERPECDQLVEALLPGGAVDPELLDRIFDRSVGNPLLAEELVHQMLEAKGVSLVGGSWRLAESLDGELACPRPGV